jgi:hypothetical protein
MSFTGRNTSVSTESGTYAGSKSARASAPNFDIATGTAPDMWKNSRTSCWSGQWSTGTQAATL